MPNDRVDSEENMADHNVEQPFQKSLARSGSRRQRNNETHNQTKIDGFTKATDKSNKQPPNVENLSEISQQLKNMEKILSDLVTKEDLKYQLQPLVTNHQLELAIKKLERDMTDRNTELLDKLEGRIFALEKKNDDLIQEMGGLQERIENQNDKIYCLTERLEIYEKELNDLEQHGRLNSIRISGLSDDKKETDQDTEQKVLDFCCNDLGVNISTKDIDITHRLGKYMEHNNRTIICKFTQRSVKEKIVKNRTLLKGTGKIVREDITSRNNTLMYVARKLPSVENTWPQNGKILVKFKKGPIRRISNTEDLYILNAQFNSDKEATDPKEDRSTVKEI